MNFQSTIRLASCISIACIGLLGSAHEGHQPLPTQGVQVDTENGYVTISGRARAAIGLQSKEVTTNNVATTLKVYAESVTPWQAKAFGSAKTAGRIARILVRPGDWVEKNQIVAQLSSRELELVRLDYFQAINDLVLNQRLFEMTQPSVQAGAIPMQRLLDIENSLEQSRNRVNVARLRARSLGLTLDDSSSDQSHELLHPIRAPIAGRILHLDLAEGQYVEAFEHLFEIVSTDQVWVRLQLLEKDVFHVKVGNRVTVQLEGASNLVEGVVDRMDAVLDPKAQVSSAWVTLGDPTISAGLVGSATIYTSEQSEKLTVPLQAVYSDGLQNYVFVEEASTRSSAEYRKKTLRLGKHALVKDRLAETMVEVQQGDVFPGDRVVVRGGHELSSLFFLGVLKLSSSEQDRLGILTEPAAYREIRTTQQIPAIVALPPANRSVLTAQLDGTVQSHALAPGRVVQAGEMLMEIASPEFYRLQLELIGTTLDAELSRRRAERLEGVQGSAVSQRVALEGRAQAEQLETRTRSLKRQISTLGLLESEIEAIVNERRLMDHLPIRANIKGRIAASVVTLGETVTANQPLFEIQHLDSVWIEGQVPLQGTRSIAVEQSGIATLLAAPGIQFPVTLSRVGPTVSESTRTQKVWLTPVRTASLPQLLPGALVTVSLHTGRSPSSLAIPDSAILRDGKAHFSFVKQVDGYIERRRINLGQSDGEYTEVVAGIEAGELVVVVGGRELQTAFASLR